MCITIGSCHGRTNVLCVNRISHFDLISLCLNTRRSNFSEILPKESYQLSNCVLSVEVLSACECSFASATLLFHQERFTLVPSRDSTLCLRYHVLNAGPRSKEPHLRVNIYRSDRSFKICRSDGRRWPSRSLGAIFVHILRCSGICRPLVWYGDTI
jgi:hypothetical protein